MSTLMSEEKLKKYICVDNCPVRNVISHFSGKWAMLILCLLAENGATRFSAIGRAIPDISPKMLAETLRSLRLMVWSDGRCMRRYRLRWNIP